MTGSRTVQGFVAAGGASSRMGRDKALLSWESSTLLEHAIERVHAACGNATVLCGATARFRDKAPILMDRYAGLGPLAALHAALEATDKTHVLVLAVDMPRVPVALLEHLAETASSADVVVPRSDDGAQPLCAAYSVRCLDPVRQSIEAGQNKMTSFWASLAVREIRAEELMRFGDPASMFANINGPGDYEALGGGARVR